MKTKRGEKKLSVDANKVNHGGDYIVKTFNIRMKIKELGVDKDFLKWDKNI